MRKGNYVNNNNLYGGNSYGKDKSSMEYTDTYDYDNYGYDYSMDEQTENSEDVRQYNEMMKQHQKVNQNIGKYNVNNPSYKIGSSAYKTSFGASKTTNNFGLNANKTKSDPYAFNVKSNSAYGNFGLTNSTTNNNAGGDKYGDIDLDFNNIKKKVESKDKDKSKQIDLKLNKTNSAQQNVITNKLNTNEIKLSKNISSNIANTNTMSNALNKETKKKRNRFEDELDEELDNAIDLKEEPDKESSIEDNQLGYPTITNTKKYELDNSNSKSSRTKKTESDYNYDNFDMEESNKNEKGKYSINLSHSINITKSEDKQSYNDKSESSRLIRNSINKKKTENSVDKTATEDQYGSFESPQSAKSDKKSENNKDSIHISENSLLFSKEKSSNDLNNKNSNNNKSISSYNISKNDKSRSLVKKENSDTSKIKSNSEINKITHDKSIDKESDISESKVRIDLIDKNTSQVSSNKPSSRNNLSKDNKNNNVNETYQTNQTENYYDEGFDKISDTHNYSNKFDSKIKSPVIEGNKNISDTSMHISKEIEKENKLEKERILNNNESSYVSNKENSINNFQLATSSNFGDVNLNNVKYYSDSTNANNKGNVSDAKVNINLTKQKSSYINENKDIIKEESLNKSRTTSQNKSIRLERNDNKSERSKSSNIIKHINYNTSNKNTFSNNALYDINNLSTEKDKLLEEKLLEKIYCIANRVNQASHIKFAETLSSKQMEDVNNNNTNYNNNPNIQNALKELTFSNNMATFGSNSNQNKEKPQLSSFSYLRRTNTQELEIYGIKTFNKKDLREMKLEHALSEETKRREVLYIQNEKLKETVTDLELRIKKFRRTEIENKELIKEKIELDMKYNDLEKEFKNIISDYELKCQLIEQRISNRENFNESIKITEVERILKTEIKNLNLEITEKTSELEFLKKENKFLHEENSKLNYSKVNKLETNDKIKTLQQDNFILSEKYNQLASKYEKIIEEKEKIEKKLFVTSFSNMMVNNKNNSNENEVHTRDKENIDYNAYNKDKKSKDISKLNDNDNITMTNKILFNNFTSNLNSMNKDIPEINLLSEFLVERDLNLSSNIIQSQEAELKRLNKEIKSLKSISSLNKYKDNNQIGHSLNKVNNNNIEDNFNNANMSNPYLHNMKSSFSNYKYIDEDNSINNINYNKNQNNPNSTDNCIKVQLLCDRLKFQKITIDDIIQEHNNIYREKIDDYLKSKGNNESRAPVKNEEDKENEVKNYLNNNNSNKENELDLHSFIKLFKHLKLNLSNYEVEEIFNCYFKNLNNQILFTDFITSINNNFNNTNLKSNNNNLLSNSFYNNLTNLNNANNNNVNQDTNYVKNLEKQIIEKDYLNKELKNKVEIRDLKITTMENEIKQLHSNISIAIREREDIQKLLDDEKKFSQKLIRDYKLNDSRNDNTEEGKDYYMSSSYNNNNFNSNGKKTKEGFANITIKDFNEIQNKMKEMETIIKNLTETIKEKKEELSNCELKLAKAFLSVELLSNKKNNEDNKEIKDLTNKLQTTEARITEVVNSYENKLLKYKTNYSILKSKMETVERENNKLAKCAKDPNFLLNEEIGNLERKIELLEKNNIDREERYRQICINANSYSINKEIEALTLKFDKEKSFFLSELSNKDSELIKVKNEFNMIIKELENLKTVKKKKY